MREKIDILNKYVIRGRRTASRIWGENAVVLILPFPWKPTDFKKIVVELTPTGTYIWKLLGNKLKLKEVVSHFAKNKKINRDIATKEVVKFIKKLAAKKMVDILDELVEE